jgi:hypothetical protein
MIIIYSWGNTCYNWRLCKSIDGPSVYSICVKEKEYLVVAHKEFFLIENTTRKPTLLLLLLTDVST